MNFTKNNILIISIVTIFCAFIWFQIRPSYIRMECKEYFTSSKIYEASTLERSALNEDMYRINQVEREKSDFWYKDCINAKGLAD
jgi:hypothetical protein